MFRGRGGFLCIEPPDGVDAGALPIPERRESARTSGPMNAHVSIADRYQAAPDHPERQYLALLEDILQNGAERGDRTGVGLSLIHISEPTRPY